MLAFLVSAIRLGMTFLLGSTGETITEKAGHLNLGIPGVMCVGAACGCYVEYLYFTAAGINADPVMAVILPLIAARYVGAAGCGCWRRTDGPVVQLPDHHSAGKPEYDRSCHHHAGCWYE